MNAQDAKLLTLETGMKLVDYAPDYELWTGDILYTFLRTTIMEKSLNAIMRDPETLCVWMDPNGCGVISTRV